MAAFVKKSVVRLEALNFPKSVLIETDSRCNGHCLFCPHRIFRDDEKNDTLKQEAFLSIINEISQFNIERITLFCNNEPLLDSRMSYFIKETKIHNPSSQVTLSTNGILLSPDLAVEYYNSGLNVLSVSVPSLNETEYKKLMHFSLYTVLNNINAVLHTDAASILSISVPETYAFDPSEFHAYFDKLSLKFASWPLEYKLSWEIMDFAKIKNHISFHPHKRCDRPLDQAVILADGNMVLCCRDWLHEFVVGSIYENTIYNLWHSQKMKNAQEKILKKQYNEIQICSDCSENPFLLNKKLLGDDLNGNNKG
jgi:radical SAM protein with 4Fe4S-binding SPASM domain